jgi:CubicO group peptidase (beta-lactamase class C family)
MTNIARISAVVTEGIAAGLHIGAQVFASIDGQAVVDSAWGESRRGVPMTTDTLMLWLSSTKPIVAVAIGQLWERGKLELDDPVARHIPEFAAQGKDGVTIRHILTHTAGFRGAALAWMNEPWDALVARVCDERPEPGWIPGKKAGYHVAGSWIILGELVRRLDGRPLDEYVRQEIFLPLEMTDCWIGMSPEQYRAFGNRIGLMHNTTGPEPKASFPADTEAGCVLCRPGSQGRGPVRQLAHFYEALLGRGSRGAQRILRPQTVEALTACHRRGMFDLTFKHIMDWGLGFIVDNNIHGADTVPYPFGRYSSSRTFGHGGYQSSVAFADPTFGLAAGIVFNGCPGEEKHAVRIRQMLAALYEDLGLAGGGTSP